MKVGENHNGEQTDFPPPEQTITDTASVIGLINPLTGMMTAATMNSFQYVTRRIGDIDVYCFLTSGLANALAAGDKGKFMPQQIYSNKKSSPFGTINIAAGTSVQLTDAALAEALMVVTEAKSSVLFELGVKSSESERIATGTGTDSAIIFCNDETQSGKPEAFCGKHTVLGEAFATVVRTALFESVKNDRLFRQ
jgi:adenosylcobinamide amidohydrolase